ncbi:MAG: hypothetical protein ABIA47_01190 [bacterium]
MKNIISALILSILLFLPVNVDALGLGISPSRISIENLVRGAIVEREIVLSRGDANEEISFTVEGEGEIADWVSTNHGNTFTIPSGDQQFPVTIIVAVPEDAANGEYTGNVRFVAGDTGDETGGTNDVAISIDALAQITLEVTGEQLLDYSVESVEIPVFEQGWPMQLIVTIDNIGNVAAAPTKIAIEFWDKYHEIFLSETEITDFSKVEPARAFSREDFVVPFNNDFSSEQYWATITIYNNDELLYETEVIFDVAPTGTLENQGELMLFTASDAHPSVGELVKLEGLFTNTGASNLISKLIVEVAKNGSIVEVLESNTVGTRIGAEETLSVFFQPESTGKYSLTGYVEYAGIKSNSKTITVRAGLGSGALVFAVLLMVAMCVCIAIYLKKRKADKYTDLLKIE